MGWRENKNKYNAEYIKEHRDRITVSTQKGKKDEWKQAAADRDKSLNAFVIDCVEKEINKEE